MTVILVLVTIVTFLTADSIVQAIRVRRASRLAVDETVESTFRIIPTGIGIAPNHLWVRPEGRGIVAVGFDEFLVRLAGNVEDLVLPKPGDLAAVARASVALRDEGRGLEFPAPANGQVTEVNQALLADTALLRNDPYGKGWLFKIHASKKETRNLFTRSGLQAMVWLQEQEEAAKQFFLDQPLAMVPITMQDGGHLSNGILKEFNNEVWIEFQKAFAALHVPADRTVPQ